jgi:hypothetical protein
MKSSPRSNVLLATIVILLVVLLQFAGLSKKMSEGFSYTSTTSFLGTPLIDIQIDRDGGRSISTSTANGWLAVGQIAVGRLVGIGVISIGIISIGAGSIGIISTGVLAIGLISLGMVSVGYLSFGAKKFPIKQLTNR